MSLQAPEILEHQESLPLLDEWLDIDLYITPEMYNEIARNKDSFKQKEARLFAETFYKVDARSSHNEFQRIKEDLRSLFPEKMRESDEFDWRQLAYAIAAEIPFFVTRDGPMLSRAEDIFDKFGIQILRPSDLILKQDELMRGDDYAPSRLAGTQIHIEKVHTQQSEKLIKKFLSNLGETKNQFNKKLQLALGKASIIDTSVVIGADNEEYGLISYSREFDDQIIVPIFRVGKAPICDIAAKYLVNNIILTASIENRNIIKINDEYLSEKIISALQESGFFRLENFWLKINLHGSINVDDLIVKLINSVWPDYAQKPIDNLVVILRNTPNDNILLETEKALWPLKIKNVNIPVFIAPIRPEWAMHLFDEDIANQDLFGGESSLILNSENVYYGSAKRILSAPGRLLWYVSAGKGHYQGAMCIKAISYIDEVEIGKPKKLFSKYKKLGIYKWKNVYNDVAKENLEKDIMAFKFSKTEIFKYPITFSKLQEIWKSDGKNFNIVSTIAISAERFFDLYEIGMEGI